MIKTLLIFSGDKKETKDSKEFPKPKKYEEFISNIIKSFNIKKKKDINLMVFTTDGDEIPINDQEDLEYYKNDVAEYRVIVEKKEPEPSPISGGNSKVKKKKEDSDNGDDDEDNKSNKDEDEPKKKEDGKNEESGSENEGDEDKDDINIKLNVNLEMTDKEIENLIEGQIKDVPEIDNNIINDDLQFNIEEFKSKLNDINISIINNFNKSFDSKINDIIINKSSIIKEKINNSVLQFSNINIEHLKKINNETKGIKDDFNEMIENSTSMNDALNQLNGGISPVLNQEKRKNTEENLVVNKQPSNNIIDEEGDEDNNKKLSIKFEKENIDFEIEKKKAKYLEIGDIIIENIGNKSYEKLFFVKDEKESSSKDINFYENSKNLNVHKLSLDGPFKPNSKGNHSVTLKINNPNPSQIYILCIYVKETEDGNNLSKALKINVKIKEEQIESPQKILEENAKKLLSEIEKTYNINIICTKKELLKKLIELNNDMPSINEWLTNEFDKKVDEFYRELNMETICDKDEVKRKIYELKFDKEQLNEWKKEMEKNKIEKIYEDLNNDFSISEKIDKNEILKIIKEKNFEKESIIEWIKSKLDKLKSPKNPEPNPINPKPVVQDNGDNNKLDEMVDLFDGEYNILNILDEEEFRQKIIDLNYNEEKIREWIEEKLSQ